MLKQQSKTTAQHLKYLSLRNQLSPAAGTGFHAPALPSQIQSESSLPRQVADAARSTSAARNISADSALAVLVDLAEIREMKADSLERSIERESVSPVTAAFADV